LSIKTDAGKAKTKIDHRLFTGKSLYQSSYALWNTAMEFNASVAIWCLPGSGDLNFLIDFSTQQQAATLDIQSGTSGFAVSPFVNPSGRRTYFLKPHIQFGFKNNSEEITIKSSAEAPPAFWQSLQEHLNEPRQIIEAHQKQQADSGLSEDRSHFLNLVNKALKLIDGNSLEKVVIARTLTRPLTKRFDLIRLLCCLSSTHPDTFVSLISIPGLGTWVGASPEMLIEVSTGKQFRTVSLAGTQAYPMDASLSEAVWKQKEIEEQAMVSRFIVAQFKSIRLREFQETGPRSIRAGSLIHLKSEYHVDFQAAPYPRLGDIMLQLLHPTSAICGMPRQAAQDFLSSYEDLERGLYGGFLGPVNMQGESQLYVNLRCIQLSPTQVTYYSGAGITHDSEAEKEWLETELKSKTLQEVVDACQ